MAKKEETKKEENKETKEEKLPLVLQRVLRQLKEE